MFRWGISTISRNWNTYYLNYLQLNSLHFFNSLFGWNNQNISDFNFLVWVKWFGFYFKVNSNMSMSPNWVSWTFDLGRLILTFDLDWLQQIWPRVTTQSLARVNSSRSSTKVSWFQPLVHGNLTQPSVRAHSTELQHKHT